MARYTGADCRKCRRAKQKLFLKGSKCDSAKCPFEARPYPPRQHGRGRSKDSEYLLQLREKQKAKQIYGIFERQFRYLVSKCNETLVDPTMRRLKLSLTKPNIFLAFCC